MACVAEKKLKSYRVPPEVEEQFNEVIKEDLRHVRNARRGEALAVAMLVYMGLKPEHRAALLRRFMVTPPGPLSAPDRRDLQRMIKKWIKAQLTEETNAAQQLAKELEQAIDAAERQERHAGRRAKGTGTG